jgi:hypothetical protein
MFKSRLPKLIFITLAFFAAVLSVQARPEYLKIFANDPYSRPELRNQCSICHINPAGGGARTDFGKAFDSAGFVITPTLRNQFPEYFLPEQSAPSDKPLVTFPAGSDSEAVLELNGKRYVINTKEKTVTELTSAAPEPTVATMPPKAEPQEERPNVYRPVDVRAINLPTAIPIPKGSLWNDYTHRFPFGEPTDTAGLFGLDSIAYPSFGFTYGITDHIHVGAYRSPGPLGRPIQLFVGTNLLNEQKGHPLSFQARVGLEGGDNFQRNFATSFEFTVARSITRHAQIYVVPTVTVGDRPLGFSPEQNLPGETAVALGVGAAVNVRPSVALMAEANMRLNEAARYENLGAGIHRPVFGFAIQKASASKRHAFALTFTNGPGTTMSQRSMTRGLFFADDGFQGLTIGFNLSRRLF